MPCHCHVYRASIYLSSHVYCLVICLSNAVSNVQFAWENVRRLISDRFFPALLVRGSFDMTSNISCLAKATGVGFGALTCMPV